MTKLLCLIGVHDKPRNRMGYKHAWCFRCDHGKHEWEEMIAELKITNADKVCAHVWAGNPQYCIICRTFKKTLCRSR